MLKFITKFVTKLITKFGDKIVTIFVTRHDQTPPDMLQTPPDILQTPPDMAQKPSDTTRCHHTCIMYGLYGLKHHIVEKSGDVTDAGRDKQQQAKIERPSLSVNGEKRVHRYCS